MRFARAGEEMSGEVRLADLDRLADVLVSDQGSARYRLRGGLRAGRPVLTLDVDTAVMLLCQRCLEPYRQELRIERVFPLARDEAQLALWEREDPLLDALVADPVLDVLTLVEDEILLSLPVAPRHAEGECGQARV
ncbi:YceD family protein [Parasulfuritortus cantonensis]|nr:YceD family protein [Parasulfuritortus cantonensis]